METTHSDFERGEIEFTEPSETTGSLDVSDPYNIFSFNTGKAVEITLSAEQSPFSQPLGSLDPNPTTLPGIQAQVPKIVQPPAISLLSSPNFFAGRQGHKVVAICNHITDGSMTSAISWFNNPASDASSNFGVAKDGTIYQWVDITNTAWANGKVNNPDTSLTWLQKAIENKINPNRLTVSIEHEGKPGLAITEAQYKASLALHKYLISKLNIPIDRTHIIGHYQIDKVERAYCPSNGFPWQRLMADLQKDLSGTTVEVAFLNYKANLRSVAVVRTGPSTTFNVVTNLPYDPHKQYNITGEAHGEAVKTGLQDSGQDDVWAFIPEVNGFVTRTALKIG